MPVAALLIWEMDEQHQVYILRVEKCTDLWTEDESHVSQMLPFVWGTRSSATGTGRRKTTRRKENCRLMKSDQNVEIIWKKIKTRAGTLDKEGTESRWTRLYEVNIYEPHWTCRALLLAFAQSSSIFSVWPFRQTPANQILYWFVAVSLHQLQPQTCVLSRVIRLFF